MSHQPTAAAVPKWPRCAGNRPVLPGDMVRFGGETMTVGRVSFGTEGPTVVLVSPGDLEACVTDPAVLREAVTLVARGARCDSCANRDVLVRGDTLVSVCRKRGATLTDPSPRQAPCAVREWGLADYDPIPAGDPREALTVA